MTTASTGGASPLAASTSGGTPSVTSCLNRDASGRPPIPPRKTDADLLISLVGQAPEGGPGQLLSKLCSQEEVKEPVTPSSGSRLEDWSRIRTPTSALERLREVEAISPRKRPASGYLSALGDTPRTPMRTPKLCEVEPGESVRLDASKVQRWNRERLKSLDDPDADELRSCSSASKPSTPLLLSTRSIQRVAAGSLGASPHGDVPLTFGNLRAVRPPHLEEASRMTSKASSRGSASGLTSPVDRSSLGSPCSVRTASKGGAAGALQQLAEELTSRGFSDRQAIEVLKLRPRAAANATTSS